MSVGQGLCGLPRTRLLCTWRQAFIEVRWDGLIKPFQYVEVLRKRPSPKDDHLLAVGCHYVFPVGGHPVEASTTFDSVPRRNVVQDVYHVVAWPSGEVVFRQLAEGVVGQKIVTFPAHHIVGTFAGPNEIVAGTSEKVLVACEGAVLLGNAEDAILARPA